MATTKLWHIQGRLKDLVDYVENPEKTVNPGLQDFFNVFSYTQNPDKTAGGQFVMAINCQKDIALQQMSESENPFAPVSAFYPAGYTESQMDQ